MTRTIAIAATAGALAFPEAAGAHVTLQPSEVPAGGFTRLDVRVPTERPDASTTKLEVQFPAGFTTVSTEPVPGWTVRVSKAKLGKPQVNDEGEKITDRVDTVTWIIALIVGIAGLAAGVAALLRGRGRTRVGTT